MRLIDADAVMEALNIFNDKVNGNEHFLNGIETAKEIIDNASTIEAEPVRHGKWIDEHCSECGQYVYHGDAQSYCPHCGAKMEVEE